jgi:hypothetical protein
MVPFAKQGSTMSITIELAPEIEQLAKAKGISVEEYLSDLVARVLQQETWGKDEA